MPKSSVFRSAKRKAKLPQKRSFATHSAKFPPRKPPSKSKRTPPTRAPLSSIVRKTIELWRRHHLTYEQVLEVTKSVRSSLDLHRPPRKRTAVERLSREDADKLIATAYKTRGSHGLLVKTLLMSGARVSEFVRIRVQDLFVDECQIYIAHAKGLKQRYVPILPALAQELRTHLGSRAAGFLFETRSCRAFTPRRVQQIVAEIAQNAGISKRVHPHLLRHTVAQHLLDGGMPLEQVQQFLGHEHLETTTIYARSSAAAIKESYRRAMEGRR